MKSLNAADLFIKDWRQLDPLDAYSVIYFKQAIQQYLKHNIYEQFGYQLKALLRLLAVSKHKDLVKQLSAEQLVDIYHDEELFFNKSFYHFHIPKLGYKGGTLHAPDEEMAKTSYIQFYYTDAAFSNYLILEQNKSEKAESEFLKFVATLYHPKGQKFDRQEVEEYTKGLKLVPYEKVLIANTYANIRQKVMERYTYLFPHKGDEKSEDITFTGPMWQQLHHSLSETPAFQGFENSAHSNMYDVLDYLNGKAKQNHEQQKK